MANLVLTTTTNPGIADWVDIASLVSGGGATIIPNGGTLGGTYDGFVICEGTSTVNANLTVRGSLITLGVITNDQGFNVLVDSDFLASSDVNFNRANTSLPQGTFQVIGDLVCQNLSFKQSGGVVSPLVVGGSFYTGLNAPTTVDLSGESNTGTNGGVFAVNGDVVMSYFAADGATNPIGPAGGGGLVVVGGNLRASEMYLRGEGGNNFDAGSGGQVIVYGDATVELSLYVSGGSGNNANGGAAGSAVFRGSSVALSEFQANGGSCSSTNPVHSAQAGGTLNVFGNLVGFSGGVAGFYLNGGTRSGVLASSAANPTTLQGGTLSVGGNCTLNLGSPVQVRGGSVTCSGGQSQDAGTGGTVQINGNYNSNGQLNLSGGSITNATGVGNAGQGGTLGVSGSVNGAIIADGGNHANGDGKDGGTLTLSSSVNGSITTLGGFGTGVTSSGGKGGYTSIFGLMTGEIDARGGDSDGTNGRGGNVSLSGGCNITNLLMNDGSGSGAAPPGTVTLILGGTCTINDISMVDRPLCRILASGSTPTILKVRQMSGTKLTLDNAGGPTASILTLPGQFDNLFSYASAWNYHAATVF